uniref:DUF7866 domain-containing protein n=1 Tax=Ananas comosus var. bracteatus TaxID=296719 RepID=A0A6V7NFV0_ANACO|nr:unnamed protein product [Ananas comosus var. bracteatus]
MGKLQLILTLTLLLFINQKPIKGAATVASRRAILTVGPIDNPPIHTADFDPFQLCLGCRCCAADNATDCLDTSCCFGIDCNLPDKPFGVCGFVPKTCNCTSCE